MERRKKSQAGYILLVDDSDDGRESVRELLEDRGFTVSEASNGKHALDLMISAPEPALVILDLEMPVMSGVELLEVMQGYERLSRLPVLIVSGSRQQAPSGGAVVGSLKKPCDAEQLLAAVQAGIEHRN